MTATVGFDIGTQNTKIILLNNNNNNDDDDNDNVDNYGKVLAHAQIFSGFDPAQALKDAVAQALKTANLSQTDITSFTATGSTLETYPYPVTNVSIMSAITKAGTHWFPNAKTIIEVGAEEARAVKCDERGVMIDFVVNERCAAGAGAFIEAMARALEIKIQDMGPLALTAERASSINAACVIFGESDVVSLIHKQEPKSEIARAVYDAMADRISAMVHRIGVNPQIVIVGGVAKDVGFLTSLKRKLGVDVLTPEFPEYAGALGAALIGLSKNKTKERPKI
ncbi:MAG: acyl-CoA dehydratase activase [Candidatus Bathyarchaeota archaeon]|uniref:acyl-CoA dehydratase activase n=1 Tax=Candidatus Bathycorpusculum sp. TaxID=2994959 RepID=UPI00281B94E8|nr:acyl-CoA dehydratase activase [Candidatus Termiticorpusculum sp.]MCL2292016.1 acyl-CoA dehydratase activase [Candidatus Termiticorpusculum sp.]